MHTGLPAQFPRMRSRLQGWMSPDNLDVDYDLNFSICAIKKRATKLRAKLANKINVR